MISSGFCEIAKIMKIATTINKTRRHLTRHKNKLAIFGLGWVVGLILNASSICAAVVLFGTLSRRTLSIGSILFLLTLFVTIPWIILLKNNLKAHQKYLKQFAPPGFDVDAQEEHSEIWDEVSKEDEFQNP